MVSLQQIDYSYLRKDESINTSQEYIVAVHRRSMTYLTYTTDTKVVKTYQHNPINHREFNNIGVWVIPNDKLIISFFPIEVYDAFLVVFDSNSYSNNDENNNGDSYSDANSNGNSNSINDRNSKNKRRNSSVMILDFSCVYIQEVALPNVESILCAEFDQHKKDLIVGLASCSVLCYSLRMVKAFEARKTNDYDAKHFHLVLRTHGKVSELTVKQPIQIASFDLLGFCLVLLANGDMICLDESSLDALWSIQGELFLIKPNRIAVDKFGIDFIVYGRNETKTKEMLEYWTPPTDFVSCEIGRFSRTSIPVTDGVLSFTIESVGHDRANALLTILSSRLSLQLWKPLGDGIISNETSLPLALTDDALSRITSAHFKQNLVDKNFIGLPHQFGVFMFNADQTKPETPVIFTATFLASVTRVAIHLPSGSDVKREQTYMNISIARLASSNEEPSSNSEVFDIFPVSNALHSPQLNSPGRTEAIFDYSKSLRLQSGDARSEITGEDMVDLLNTNNENALPESPLAGEQLEDGSIASNQSYQAQSIISDVDKELLVRNMQSADDIVREPPDRSMFESLHENSSLLASYLNSEIFGNRRSNHPNGDANFSRPNSAAILEAPSTFYYEPYSKFFNNSLAEQNFFSVNKTMSMFQIVAPFSVLVYNKAVSDPADNSMSETEMFLCTRKGLINVFKYNGNIADLCEELSFTKLSFAFRTGKLFIFTDYKEGYLYDISSNLTHPEAPVRINLNMKKSCSTMIVVAADVALLHPQFKPKHPHQSKKGSFLTAEEVENIGTYTVYFLGDSDGNVHFTICHKASVVSNGILRAHSSAITKISTTGDAIRPLWRVGSSRSYDNSTQIVPNSVPGSAIVTTSKDGEVKVWQPIFTHPQGGRGRAAIDRVFLEFSLSWRMVGLFTTGVKTANDPYSRSVQSISLDPTCMTVLLGFQNGTIQQWCIPGLVDLDNGQLNTVHKPIWSSNLHTNSVTELNVWLHQSNTTIADVDVSKQNERRIEVIAELAAYIKGAPNRTVGYKLQHLRELSRNSSMTSSSGDRSIILWGFEVSKSVSDFVSFYLMPYPARRFFFSSSPRHGICSCYTSSTKPEHNMWKISALVNGIVVLVHQEARGLLFVADKLLSSKVAGMELIEISEPSVKKAVDFSMTDFFPNDDVAALGGMSAMPAIGQIHKASKFIDSYNHHIKNKKQRVSSTNILEEWTMVAKDLAPVVSTVHFDPNDHNDIRFLLPDEAESQGENIDHLVAVPRPASPFKITTKVANTLSGGKYIVDRHEDVDESTAPKRVSGIAMELGVDNSRVEQRSINMQGQVKVVHNGIAMVANDKLQLDTLKNPKKDPGQRYVVVKVDLPSPERLTETPATKGADVSQMIPFDFSTQSISDTRSKPSTRMGRMEQPAPSSIFLDSQSDIHSENNSVSEAASAIVDSIIKVFQTPKVLNDESSVTNRDDADVMPITDSINGDSLTSARRCLNEDNLAEGQDIFPISVPDAIVESTKSDQKSKEILISPSKQKSSSEKNHAKKEKRSVVLEDMEKRSTEHKSANVKNEIKDIKDEKRKIQKVKSKPKLIIENHNQQSVVRRKDPIDYKDTMNSLDIRQQHIYPQQDDMPTTPSSLGSQDSKDHDHLLKDDEPAKLRQTDKRSSNFIRQLNDDELSDDDYHDEEVKTETFGHSKKNHIKKIKLDGRIERLRQEKIQRASQLSHPSKQKIVLTKQKSKVEIIKPIPKKPVIKKEEPVTRIFVQRKSDIIKSKVVTTRSIEPTIDLPSPKMHPDTPPTTFESIIRVPTLRAISIDINEDKINETRNKQIGFLTRHLSAKSIDTRDFEIPKDEEGVIVFDRSAAPVFVDREKPVIQRLISKRFQTHVASIDIDELLDSLTDEQRTLYASLPVDERGNFLSSLTGQNGMGMLVMDDLSEKLAALKIKPRLIANLIDISDKFFKISVTATCNCRALIVLTHGGLSIPSFQSINDLDQLEFIEGFIRHEQHTIASNSTIDIIFDKVRPSEKYRTYVFFDSTGTRATNNMDDEDDDEQDVVALDIQTHPETLEIEWSRLDSEMQMTELQAVVRSGMIQEAAKKELSIVSSNGKKLAGEEGIILPTDEDLRIIKNKVANSKDSNAYLTVERGGKLGTFLRWYLGEDYSGNSNLRKFFLHCESLFAITNKKVRKKYIDQGFTTSLEAEFLLAQAKESLVVMSALAAVGIPSVDDLSIVDEIIKFRSWYKAGQLVVDYDNAEEERIKAEIIGVKALMNDDDTDLESLLESKESNPAIEEALRNHRRLQDELLYDRTDFLRARVDEVDKCKLQIHRLVEGHKFAISKKLKDTDLVAKRGILTPKELHAIMCSIKLTNLCVKSKLTTKSVGISALPVSSFGVPPFTFQTISNTDIFQAINPETLKPDDPPPLSMATLPGTDRRPRKPWQMCNENEKQMEMVLACSLDQIIELAIDEGIAIPDPEDFTIPLNLFPTREERLKKFCVWYAGDEEKNKIPGQGIPTLARVVLSETFEDLSVDHDPFVLSTMQHNNMPMPPFCLPEDHPDYRPKPEIVEEIHDGVKRYHLETISVDSNDEEEEYATLLQAYERAVTTGLGKCLRINLISRTVNIIMSSRRTGMLRYIWPPGPARSGLQYMFPRMGIISPKFELPARRIKVFPSRSIESYTYAEMTHWYSLVDLEDDDMIMRKAEADGVRLREYNEWLSHEKERVVESRLMMTDEDYRGKLSRESWKLIEKNFKEYSIALEEKVLARDKDDELQKMGFMFSHDLPKEYWYIFEESTEFRHGNGIDNGDELEDIRLAQYERGKIAREEAIKFENYLQEERKKRDAEEQARLKREEQDRRLAEGILRRRKLRDHLEDLKRQRIFQQEEQRRREENEKLLKQLMELEEEKRRQEELLRQQAHDSMMKERRLMGLEEHTQRELHIRTRETHLMEHEDIMSFMVSQAVARAEKKKLLRLCALEELYVPFEPFQFRNERTNYKEMERFLAEEMDCLASILGKKTPFDEPIAMSVGTRSTKASEISFAKETKSTLYKKSSRHSLLYDIDRLKSNDSLVSSISLASLESAPDWLKAKKSDAKEEKRMLLDSNPSKIQDFPSVTKHIQSDYNHEWKIFPDMSPQCFVLTSKSTFPSISRDGKVATNRNLAKLAPIFDSSKRQHEIEKVRNEQEKMNLLSTFVNVTSSMRDRMDASLNMADSILSKTVNGSDNGARYKFDGSDVASLIPSIKPVFAPSSAESGSPLNNSKNELLQNSKADESMDVSLQSGYRVILPIVPKEYNSNNDVNRRGIAEGIKDLESMELRSSQNNSSSINQSLSIFRPSIWRTNAEKNNLGNTKRQELKKLLTASAEAVQLEDQKEKLLFSSSQKVLSFASLASIDSHDPKGKPRKVNKANKDTKVVPVKGKLGEKKRGALLNELSFNIGEEGLMDSRTKKLATKAGEVVERMQKERALLRNYISSNAVFGDNYYLQTCEPEERQHTSLSVADDVLNYIHGGSIGKEWLPDNEVRRSMLASNSVEIEQKSRSFISNHTSQFLSDSKSTTSRENSNNITDGDKMKLLSRTLSSTSPRAMSAKVPSLSPDGLLLVKEVHAQYPPMSPISKKRKETTRINANRRPIDLVINTPIAMSNHDKSREKALTLELMIEGNRNISGDQLYPDGLEDSIDSSPAPDHRTRGKLASPSRLIQMSISDDGADSIITK